MPIVVLDADGAVLWTNSLPQDREIESEFHWSTPGDSVGANYINKVDAAASSGDGIAAEALSGILDVLQQRSSGFQMEYCCRMNVRPCWLRMDVTALGEGEGAIITYLDISRQKQMEVELQQTRERIEQDTRMHIEALERRNAVLRQNYVEHLENECALRQAASVFVNSSEAVVITDAGRRIIKVNEGFSEISGYLVEDVFGQALSLLRDDRMNDPPDEILDHSLEVDDHWQGEYWCRRRNGETYPAWGTIDAVRDEAGHLKNYICLFSDITRLKESQGKLHYLAHHDPLTGLANRLLFWARLEQSIQHARRHKKRIALLFLDIDEFKVVNDTLGHPAGDQLLRQTAERLSMHVRGEDTIARLGGDEFGVIAEEIINPQDAEHFADKLNSIISMPMEIAETCIQPAASIGIGIYPEDGETPESLYRAADEWMYRSKRNRRDTSILCNLEYINSKYPMSCQPSDEKGRGGKALRKADAGHVNETNQ